MVSSSRYKELLKWAGAALSAQGLDEETVGQTLLSLSQPMEMEDVRGEVGGGENRQRGEEGEESEGTRPETADRPPTGRLGPDPEATRSCR